jgi:hypothetical protein
MNCQFCHTQPKDPKRRWGCSDCMEWLNSLNYSYSSENGQLTNIWFKLFAEKDKHYYIYFYLGDRFSQPKTVVEEYQNNSWKKTALQIDYVLPITKKTIRDLPKKLKLWQTFS